MHLIAHYYTALFPDASVGLLRFNAVAVPKVHSQIWPYNHRMQEKR